MLAAEEIYQEASNPPGISRISMLSQILDSWEAWHSPASRNTAVNNRLGNKKNVH